MEDLAPHECASAYVVHDSKVTAKRIITPSDSLEDMVIPGGGALYVSLNPRDARKAASDLVKSVVDDLTTGANSHHTIPSRFEYCVRVNVSRWLYCALDVDDAFLPRVHGMLSEYGVLPYRIFGTHVVLKQSDLCARKMYSDPKGVASCISLGEMIHREAATWRSEEGKTVMEFLSDPFSPVSGILYSL